MTLPTNISACKVDLRLLQAAIDAGDADRLPDGVALMGATVDIQASIPFVRVGGDAPAIIPLATIPCVIDAQGRLCSPDGTPGVYIVASDDPDIQPSGWTYTATIKHTAITPIKITFSAPTDGAIDLATVAQLPANPGATIAAWTEAVNAVQALRNQTIAARDEVASMDVLTIVEEYLAENPPEGSGGSWETLAGKPAIIAAGPSAADARAAIGTVSGGEVGFSIAAALASNQPAWSSITDKPSNLASGPTVAAARASIGATSIEDVTASISSALAAQPAPTWTEVSGKPTFVAAGASAALARSAIGAGTSNLEIGTTGSTAAAGNDPRLSDQRVPTDGSVTNAKVASGISADKLVEGSTNKLLTAAERSKLATGVATPAELSAVQAKIPYRSVKDYGALGDGSTDDTAAIQATIAAAAGSTVRVPPGTYMVNAGTGIQLNVANTRFELAPGAIIQAITNALTNYAIINVTASDCTITGGVIRGDVTTHTGSTGEWGHGIVINGGGSRTTVSDLTVKNCWGDGIYIGNGTPTDVKITDVIADSNRRQGLSAAGATRLRIVGGSYINTGAIAATSPAAGIDIEPNPSSGYNVLEFLIEGAICTGNVGPGIQVTRATGQTTRGKISGCITQANQQSGILAAGSAGSLAVDAVACTAAYNTGDGFQAACPGLVISGGRAFANTRNGVAATAQVDIADCAISYNGRNGVLFDTGSNNSQASGLIVRNNCTGTATTYHEIDVVSTGLILSGSIARSSTSGNRAIYAINVRSGATGAIFAGCRATAGTSGAISPQGDTVQAPAVS